MPGQLGDQRLILEASPGASPGWPRPGTACRPCRTRPATARLIDDRRDEVVVAARPQEADPLVGPLIPRQQAR